jgi:predicted DNA-binding transcriptional regulator AlpA
MDIEAHIRDIVRQEIAELQIDAAGDPELIKVTEAAKLCGVSRSVIDALIKEAPQNGFPAVRLSPQRIVIDKRRLNKWFERGGIA